MSSTHRFSVIATALVFSVSLARGQGPDPSVLVGKIADWPAPATWSPDSVSGGISTMGAVTSPLPFIGLAPCRIVDTRGNGAPIQGGMFTGGSDVRDYAVAGICGIPLLAQALSLNFTVVGPTGSGFLVSWPTGGAVPPTSILNFNAGDVRNNAAVVPTNTSTSFTVNVSAPTHVIIDVNGYYGGPGVGPGNTFLGLSAGNLTMTASFNTAIGYNTFISNTTGSANTAIGHNTLVFSSTGSNNTALGNLAGFNVTGGNNICIGHPGVAGESGAIRIGAASQTATFVAGINGVGVTGVPVLVSGSGQLGVASSSRYVKEDIREIAEESDGLMKLRPVAFRYKPQIDPAGLAQYGLIAEEVADVYPDLVVYRDGRPETVRYHLVNALLLNEVQKQHRTVEAQEKANEAQQRTIEELRARLSRLEARLLADSRP